MRLVAYQPDMAPNVGALIRLGACFAIPVEIIAPCGFPMSDKDLKRVAMDYGELAKVTMHDSWPAFLGGDAAREGRLVLLTTKADQTHADFAFQPNDLLLLGRESAGAPREVHDRADARVRVPMAPGARSLNIAMAGAIVLSEALRQTDGLSFAAG